MEELYYELYSLNFQVVKNENDSQFTFLTEDPNTLDIDAQVMVGPALLVSPVLTEGANYVNAYFPLGVWYNYFSQDQFFSTGTYINLSTPLYETNLHVRGGYIIPMVEPAMTTMDSRMNPFNLLIAFDQNVCAKGYLFTR